MKKKLFALLMAGVMAFALIGCGNSGAPTTAGESSAKPAEASSTQNTSEPKKATVAVIFKALTAEYWKTMKEGCDAAAKDFGINVTVLGPNAESEIAQQVTMIEEQLSVGVDAIAVAPCEENAVIGALSPYLGKLPIIAVDTDFNLEGKTAFIGTGNTPAAKLGGEFAAKAIGKGENAVLIGGQQGEGTSAARLEGFTQGLEENGCTVLETQYGKNTADGAIAVMEDLLTKYPGKINAVLAMNDDMIQGCLQAIKNAGISGITLVGFNGDSAVLHLIDSGEIDATVAQQPYSMGYQCVAQAYKAIQGEKIEEYQDVPALLITKENVVSFLK
ncbi:MAG TPA: sugar ABC transporter substrate-binding protein [Lachnospiraceae bacterium]|nr:sugar ABC transporter substrate-binding protein [Lachnospiraceae bacterium]